MAFSFKACAVGRCPFVLQGGWHRIEPQMLEGRTVSQARRTSPQAWAGRAEPQAMSRSMWWLLVLPLVLEYMSWSVR
eukprot:12934343-Prorocentrum_lima.AAC.1